MPNSIRWRLPFSYGAIAFLTIAILGGALLLILNGFYSRQERRYLAQNASAVSQMVSSLLAGPELDNFSQQELLQSQINGLAYLTQTRIRLFDPAGSLLVDSGEAQNLRVASTLSLDLNFGEEGESISQSIGRANNEDKYTTALVIEEGGARYESQTTISGDLVDPAAGIDGQALSLVGLQPPGAFGLDAEPGIRSGEVVQQAIVDLDGRPLGIVELSQGPAFGRAILASVGRGLVLAGFIAVLLATLAGWFISRRLSRPVLELVQTTEKMSAGDLSVRTGISRKDELGQLATSFNEMAGQIEDTVTTLEYFVADAAHEMNTPLTALRTHLELAARDRTDDPYLAGAITQALRLEQLNDDLLQLSRLEAGIGLENIEPVDLSDLLERLGEPYAAQAEQGGVDFELDTPQEPVIVEGNRELLARATGNLIDNAIKFTPQGGRVTLSLGEDDSWAWITVTDTGIGIEEADQALIFNRFHRGRNAAEYTGSGLGLAITHSIIEAHGGRIEVSSEPGHTRIQMCLRQSTPKAVSVSI